MASTCHVDLGETAAAAARGHLAWKLADEAGHREIAAWCLETRAWQQLTDGVFVAAAQLSRAAQSLAPEDSSAFIQATAQEGRALARLGDSKGTYDAPRRVAGLVSGLSTPDRPEHHFRYDPAKSDAYVATTLAWLGDPAAESYARHVLADLAGAASVRPRRIASANLDLGPGAGGGRQPDEAAHVALAAVESGRLVPSNYCVCPKLSRGSKAGARLTRPWCAKRSATPIGRSGERLVRGSSCTRSCGSSYITCCASSGARRPHSLPLSAYSGLGGLRQDPRRAAESPAEGQNLRKWGVAKCACC
ncbi:hypothetical protein [Nocardia nepalensis]|uniref:hypothetical protein n=1 Tax=Nocardia nepalensis TaxID=3375448 RepID=UPI003B68355A